MNHEYIKAVKLQAKLTRLATMKASFKFRLSAMAAADNRPGKVWEITKTAAERELADYVNNRRTIGAW